MSSGSKPIKSSPPQELPKQATESSKYALIPAALGILAMLGGLTAAGLLYSSLGYSSFYIGGGGIAAGIILLVAAKYGCQSEEAAIPEKTPLSAPKKRNRDDVNDLIAVYRETMTECEKGYDIATGHVTVDNRAMLAETETYDAVAPLEGSGAYQTTFLVRPDDTLNVLIELAKQGKNPVGINMANRHTRGGGVEHGTTAQEEAICRRSNHMLGLRTQAYPFPEKGGIYCPHVQVFKKDDLSHMDAPIDVALVAVAAYNLKPGKNRDLDTFRLPADKPFEEALQQCEAYKNGTKEKMRNMLRIMYRKGHTTLVLGALGCGAFRNPPQLVAKMFEEIFQENEFDGRFERVEFAILKLSDRDQANIDAFQTICETLDPHTF